MATVGCPPGYTCPPPVQVPINQLEPVGGGWEYLYTPFENQGDPNTEAIGEYMDFGFTVSSAAGLLAAFENEAPLSFWSAWRQEFVNAGSDMYTAKVYVHPPASYPGTATYRIIVVHSQAVGTFLDFIAEIIGTIAKSPFLIVFLGIIFFGQTILAALKNFCDNVAGNYCHPIGSAFNAYIGVIAIGALLTLGTYIAINAFSKHEGLGPIAPPAPAGFATPGLQTTAGVHLGPVRQEAGISTGGAAPTAASYRGMGNRVSRGARAVRHGEEKIATGGLGRTRR